MEMNLNKGNMVRSCASNARALCVCARVCVGRGQANHRRAASLAATGIAGAATAMHYKFSCFSTTTHTLTNMGICAQKPFSRLFNYSIIINDITYLYNGITKCLCGPKSKELSFSSVNK